MNDTKILYTVNFCGHYPVGAVAIVAATSEAEAIAKFLKQLAVEEPTLVEFTPVDELDVEELDLSASNDTKILLNGDY